MRHLSSLRFLRPAVLAAPLLFAPLTLEAQSRRTGTLTGVVLDEGGVPVPNVEVAVAKVSRMTRTDSAGRFILALLPTGSYDVAFRRVSYAPMMFMIEITQNDTTDAQVKMNAVAQPMGTIHVEERPERVRTLPGFDDRKRIGVGHFITRDQIEKRNPNLLSDLVRMIPGTNFRPAGFGRSVLRFARAESGRGDCPPTYFIDGTMATGYNLDDMPVSDVEAIELYSGLSGLPAEFAKARSTITCGTVVIWTRIPGKKK
ncbi:MAG TPA: carboxypeptidase regulatory-like domain-containing protein [Gemmatimonadaceae bacterium]